MKEVFGFLRVYIICIMLFAGTANAQISSAVSTQEASFSEQSNIKKSDIDLTQIITVSMTLGFAYAVLKSFK